jgi:hypothetical protein
MKRKVYITIHTTGETPQYDICDNKTDEELFDRTAYTSIKELKTYINEKGWELVSVAQG